MIDETRSDIRKRGARISPRSLSALTRQLIVDEFRACGDLDAVAKAYHLPVRTIDSVLHWAALRKPAASAALHVVEMRRTA